MRAVIVLFYRDYTPDIPLWLYHALLQLAASDILNHEKHERHETPEQIVRMTSERERCTNCETLAQAATLNRFGGICRRCSQRPKNLRLVAIIWFVAALGSLALCWLFESQIAFRREHNTTTRVFWLIAIVYNAAGLTGTRVLFGLGFCLSMLLAGRYLFKLLHCISSLAECRQRWSENLG